MEYTRIANLPQNISRIGLGTWAMGGWLWGGTDEKAAIQSLCKALDLGVTLIDTAPVYGFGLSEKIVGKALKEYGKREDIVIATKVGLNWNQRGPFRDCRKERIFQEVEDSLKRLQVESIDLYQIHWPDPLVPIEECATAMHQLLKQGKIKAIGVSNFNVELMKRFHEVAPLHSLQNIFNLFEHWAQHEELPYCKEKDIKILGYGSLCRGLLSGKMQKHRAFQGDDLRKTDPKFQEPHFSDYLLCVEQLKQWALQKYQCSIAALAIRWSLDSGIDIPLVGIRNPDQLRILEEVWGWNLTEEDRAEIASILHKTIQDPLGPDSIASPPDRTKTIAKTT